MLIIPSEFVLMNEAGISADETQTAFMRGLNMEKSYAYDYLIVGAGLYGAVFAHEMSPRGKKCLVIDKRPHIAGNIYCYKQSGICVHKYGAHIFHTSSRKIWEYINQFAEFNRYTNSPVAVYHDEVYNLPFNMNTFSRLWGVRTPEGAKRKPQEQIRGCLKNKSCTIGADV